MHFMGIAGMPRRISDYPDSFAGLNFVASLGSMISVAASLLFFYLILDALLQQKRSFASATWAATTSRQAEGEEAVRIILSLVSTSLGLWLAYLLAAKGLGVSRSSKTQEAEIAEKADAAMQGQLNFQTPATEIMEKIVDLHNDLFFFIIVIVLFVS